MSVNRTIVAKLHLRQVEVLSRLGSIESGIEKMIPTSEILRVITKGGSFSDIAEKLASLIDDVRVMIRKQFKELAYRSHDMAVDALFDSIPKKVIDYLIPIEPKFEWTKPERPGKLVFEGSTIYLVYEDTAKPFGVPSKLVKHELTDEEKEEIQRDVIFPPPSQAEVARIINTGSHIQRPGSVEFDNWEKRFDRLSKQISDKRIAFNELVQGYAGGENINELQKRLEPLVGGVKASARRIARTEGSRIAEQIQRRTWDDLGDMMVGAQVIAVLDERTRPEHATRNGRTYYRRPGPGQRSLNELPDLPDGPNCRCISTPILEPPEEFLNDPQLRDEYRAAANPSGLPSAYQEWFETAPIAKRKMVTGVERYKEVQAILKDKREPRWSDFIDADGQLLPLDRLINETAVERQSRIQAIERQTKIQTKAIKAISSRGFERPNRPGSSRDIRRTVSGLSFAGKVDLKINDDQDDLEELLDDYLPGATVRDLVKLAGAPDGSKVDITNDGNQIAVRIEYSEGGQRMTATRLITRQRGKVLLWNVSSVVEPAGSQIGLDMFRRQIDSAISLGVAEIQCQAERGPEQNGYYTWALFGFASKHVDQDQLLTEEGRAEWLANGHPFHGTFDLSPGSRSRQIFERYYGQKMMEANKRNQS